MTQGRLIQGEILGPLVEYVPQATPVALDDAQASVVVAALTYPLVMLMTQDCDLEQDGRLRLAEDPLLEPRNDVGDDSGSVPHLLLCPLFEDIRSVVAGGDIAKRAKKNQDVRYHAFTRLAAPEADAANDEETVGSHEALPLDLFIDFRRFVSLPTDLVYGGVASGAVQRVALVPEMNRLEVAQRFFGYQSRIPVP